MRLKKLLFFVLFVVLLPVACSDDSVQATCRDGTAVSGGYCLSENGDIGVDDDSEGQVVCGEGTVLVDWTCVLEERDAGLDASPPPDAGLADIGTGPDAADADDADADDADADDPDSDDAGPDVQDADTNDVQPDVDCLLSETEWCDGRDNDCNGIVDDGEVCPDDSVAHTTPFTEGVFLQGTTSEGSCGADALQQFWPTLELDYYSGFDCHANRYVFRMSDGEIFYYATFSGILDDVHNQPDPTVDTPPCGSGVNRTFSFDGQGRMYYQCQDTLRRENGELIAYPIKQLVVTLDDGRSVVTMASNTANGDDYVVVDQQGRELARLNPRAEFVGSMTVDPRSASTLGNEAFVLFRRIWGQGNREYVAYRLTAQNQWQRMRRVEVSQFGWDALVISDGTVFVNEPDPNTTFDNQIVAYLGGGQRQIVWREANAMTVRQHIGEQMLVGPKDTR
jgi:hypothetical protein